MQIRDPGWKNSDSESGVGKIRIQDPIRDKPPGSKTLDIWFSLSF
jgi:hypothetical protein